MNPKKKKGRKRETKESWELDEDDYELLQEANVTGFHRPKSGSKKFMQLKKAGRNADVEEEKTGFSDEDDMEEGGRTSSTAEEKLKRSLFADDEGMQLFGDYWSWFLPFVHKLFYFVRLFGIISNYFKM